MIISGRSMGIIIGFIVLILVILSLGCLDNSDDSGNVTMLNKTANGTYSVADVSFKCPDNWFVIHDNLNGNITIVASPIHESNTTETKKIGPFEFEVLVSNLSFTDPKFEVDITPNNGISEQKTINKAKNEYMPSGNKIYTEKIVIGGQNSIKAVVIFNDTNERFEYICFVKNGKTYLITSSALSKDFNKEKANFDIILKSFQVQ